MRGIQSKSLRPIGIFLFLAFAAVVAANPVQAQVTDPGPVGGTQAMQAPRDVAPTPTGTAVGRDILGFHRIWLAAGAERWADVFTSAFADLPRSRMLAIRSRR